MGQVRYIPELPEEASHAFNSMLQPCACRYILRDIILSTALTLSEGLVQRLFLLLRREPTRLISRFWVRNGTR